MAGGVKEDELAVRELLVDEVADTLRGDHVLRALQDEAPRVDGGQISAVIGQKGDASELLRDVRIGHAEGVGELLAELRSIGIAHDDGSHGLRPAHVVGVEKFEKLASKVLPRSQVAELRDAMLGVENLSNATRIAELLARR